MKNSPHFSKLRVETLEERTLLAVMAGGTETAVRTVEPPKPTLWIVNTLEDSLDWTADDDVVSLREAIERSDDGDWITFDEPLTGGRIVLCGDRLEINRGVTITASWIGGIAVDGNQKSGVFTVGSQKSLVELIGLTITNGLDEHSGGGGIAFLQGTLKLTDCAITNNFAYGYGGGIYQSPQADDSRLIVENCLIADNESEKDGGGIFSASGSLYVDHCMVVRNYSVGYGSGIFLTHEQWYLNVTNCVISDNNGGGIYSSSNTCYLEIINSAIFGNRGYGVYSGDEYGVLEIYNCTITGNEGGIFNHSYLTCLNSIVAQNFSNNLVDGSDDAFIANTIINSEPGFVIPPIFDEFGNLTNIDSIDISLSLTSPAVNAGNNRYVWENYDLAGNPRIQCGTVDIGAYESHEAPSTVVTTLEDVVDITDGLISLREAINYAEEGNTITFASELAGRTIDLTGSEIVIDKGITIDASAVNGITIGPREECRVFYICNRTVDVPVELIGLTIVGGFDSSSDYGGGIYNDSTTLIMTDCTVSGNTASCGGGIYNGSGTLTMTNCIVSYNHASSFFYLSPAYGGGIYNIGTLTMTDCTVLGNTTASPEDGIESYGGGIYNTGMLIMTDCTVWENESSSNCSYILYPYSCGGGIYNDGTLTMTTCNILGNRCSSLVGHSRGGGIYNNGTSNMISCDVWMNRCNSSGDSNSSSDGGGVYNKSVLTMTNCTVSGNESFSDPSDSSRSLSYGGGIHNVGMLTMTECIVSGNTATSSIHHNIKTSSSSYSFGGGVYNNDTLTMTCCTVSENTSSSNGSSYSYSYGGGICHASGTLTTMDCTVSENTSSSNGSSSSYSYGGGVYNYAGKLSMTNCTVSGNTAEPGSSGSYGGGICSIDFDLKCRLTLTNCIVSENSASSYGGGIYIKGSNGNQYYPIATLSNCTISRNYSGGIYNVDVSVSIRNTIIVLNSGYEFDCSNGSFYATNILSSFTKHTIFDSLVYDPSLPLFTNEWSGDYTLAENSQAIDVGNNDYVTTDTDRGGYTRIVNGIVDLGAYEYQGKLVAPTILTGNKGVYVSAGANRHQITWTAVENASGYELAHTSDGIKWSSVWVGGTSETICNLTYRSNVTYRVRALGEGSSFADSDWSDSKSFVVCPIDINNDGDITGGDRTLLGNSWLSEVGEDEYRYYCDINGDGDIGGADRVYLSNNWLLSVEDDADDLVYPPAKISDAVFAGFASADLAVDLNVF